MELRHSTTANKVYKAVINEGLNDVVSFSYVRRGQALPFL